ncbi:hypothetical protein TNCV_1627241 [Trichonephila clavipes]|nr:hypothetical protein TNCV_1627241 [Trichonephila clavipes]
MRRNKKNVSETKHLMQQENDKRVNDLIIQSKIIANPELVFYFPNFPTTQHDDFESRQIQRASAPLHGRS